MENNNKCPLEPFFPKMVYAVLPEKKELCTK